jgi:hypothetical protein
MTRSQQIRLSQFITTYGPGALLEGPTGPRIIPAPSIGLFGSGSSLNPEKYEISDRRMSQGLLKGARIFRLPSNAELGIPEDQPVYKTKPFPNWKLCLNVSAHNGDFYILYQGNSCPVCSSTGTKGREAIRFIRACSAGHMDEVEWDLLAHQKRDHTCPHNRWFKWFGGGGTLAKIVIECPRCGSRESLGTAYGSSWNCSGRFPENEPFGSAPYRPGCNRKAQIIQRQASNLRIPELLTLFSIPNSHTRLHNLIQIRSILDSIIAFRPSSKQQLEKALHNLAGAKRISQDTVDEILSNSWEEIDRAISDVLSPIPASYHDLILEEFHALMDGSINGIPPVRGPAPQSPVLIEINPSLVCRIPGPNGNMFRVTPVLKLSTVTVQRGYRREVGPINIQQPSEIVDVSFPDPLNQQQIWYPGVEFLGEGIFIMLDRDDGWFRDLSGSASNTWMNAFQNPLIYSQAPYVFRDSTHKEELHPVFVWWHTLSHLLIRSISAEAGYSSASIRERIYFEHNNSRVRGGILLYATCPGSEGTLGGLIALVPYFQIILKNAFEQARTCSCDPLCIQHNLKEGQFNGAACYGCVLISETSCEHRNMWLDRNVLLENLP